MLYVCLIFSTDTRQNIAESFKWRNLSRINTLKYAQFALELPKMTLNTCKTIPLTLTGILLAFSSLPCLACEGAPTAAELANATYTGVEEGPVTLVEGRWQGEPYEEGGASRPSAGLVEDFSLAGDLNGDGLNEATVVLWQSSGGSGTFSYLAVMGHSDGEVKNLGTAEIGDRVKLRSGRIDDGSIFLDVLQQGEGDAACCPTQLATRTWSMVDGQLIEGEMEITGTLSLGTLAGTEWVLTQLNWKERLPGEAEVTLAFGEGKISGKSACNRYSASVEQGEEPADLKIGPAMGTRMACPGELMELEHKYLDALTHVTGFSFLAGKLVLTWENDGNWSTMLFTPVIKGL
jgi:heat shock protein HslJ